MSKIIQDFHPLQYGVIEGQYITNSQKLMYGTKQMFTLENTEPSNIFKRFFTITSEGDYKLTFEGNGSQLSNSYKIILENDGSTSNIKENVKRDNSTSLITNVKTTISNPATIQNAFFITYPKHGGIIFWSNYSSIIYIVQQILDNVTEDTYFTFSAFDKTSSTSRFFFESINEYTKIKNIVLPEQIETYIPSTSINRYDHRGYNLTRGGSTWLIYPYILSNNKLVDTYYYDGGSATLNDFEVINIEDRVFLCLSALSNFLIELKIPEEDQDGDI